MLFSEWERCCYCEQVVVGKCTENKTAGRMYTEVAAGTSGSLVVGDTLLSSLCFGVFSKISQRLSFH